MTEAIKYNTNKSIKESSIKKYKMKQISVVLISENKKNSSFGRTKITD